MLGLHLPPSYLYPESGLVPVPHLHNIQATNWGQVAGVDLSCHFLEHVFTVPFSGACIVGFIAVCEIVADRHVQIWRHVENDCLRSLIHAFITSRLDYCNSLYARCNASVLQRLQRVQNCAARYILNAPPRSPSLPLLHHLHWLPIESRICYKLCSLMYRVKLLLRTYPNCVFPQLPCSLVTLVSDRPLGATTLSLEHIDT